MYVAFTSCIYCRKVELVKYSQDIFVPYLSPDAEIKYLQSLVNFIPVTISARQESLWNEVISPKCPSDHVWASSVTRVSEHRGHTFPRAEFKDADVFVRAAGGHVPTRRIKLYLRGPNSEERVTMLCYYREIQSVGCVLKCYPDQASVLAQRPLVELLLFAIVDVKDPVYRRKFVDLKKTREGIFFFFKEKHRPDTAVLAANSGVLAGGVDTHVIEGGLPYHVVRASKLSSSVSLLHHKQISTGFIIRINEVAYVFPNEEKRMQLFSLKSCRALLPFMLVKKK